MFGPLDHYGIQPLNLYKYKNPCNKVQAYQFWSKFTKKQMNHVQNMHSSYLGESLNFTIYIGRTDEGQIMIAIAHL